MTKKRDKMSKSAKLFLKIFISITLAGAIIALGVLAGALFGFIDTTADLKIEDAQLNFTSFVYYSDPSTGEEIEYERLHDEENRVWVDFADIPTHLKNATVAIEDERFYKHSGFDIKSTTKAIYTYIFQRSTSRGASTITQQLVKNLTGDAKKTPVRKIQEIIRAVNLEQKLSKDQILELYLNTIYLSQGCSGIGSAANFYFDKDVKDLTVAESACLVGITQYPTRYDPIINPKTNKEKQELVLSKMLSLGYIDQKTHDSAVAEKLKFKEKSKVAASSQSYFVDEIVRQVLKDLQEQKGYTEALATKMLYSGGLSIYSTVDPVVQEAMNKVYKDDKNFAKAPSSVQPESSMTVIDPATGYIKGIVGGRGEKNASRTLNRATQSFRQPGSTIKPLSVYAPALENNLITPTSIYEDKPIKYGDWAPKNYYSGFKGSVSVRYAVEISINTVPVQILEKLGVNNSYNFLKDNLGVTSLDERDKNLGSLALGGLTKGITNVELAAGYAPFINKGIYNTPVTYTKVLDHSGKVILENKPKSNVAFSQQTATLMTSMLKGVVDNGTGAAARFSGNYAIAGKTGTTDDDVDRWFVGMTPYYVGVVWFGFDSPKPMNYLSSNPTIPIWKKVMAEIHANKNLPAKVFEESSGLVRASYCIDSGGIPIEACALDTRGNRVRTDYFKKGTAPTSLCTYHTEKSYRICSLSGLVATEFCPPELVVTTTTPPLTEGLCNIHLQDSTQGTNPSVSPKPSASPIPKIRVSPKPTD